MASVIPRIGDLRESVRIERRATTTETTFDDDAPYGDDAPHYGEAVDDGLGNVEGHWTTLVPARPAKISPRRGGEDVQAARLSGREPFDVWLRRDPLSAAIAVGDRVVDARDETRVFNIRWVGNLDERGRFLVLQCEAGVAT